MASTSIPSTIAAGWRSSGVTTALFGIKSTPIASASSISTSAFIPGRSSPESLSSCTITGNMVTFCCTSACGSIFSTIPTKRSRGYASTVTVARIPARMSPMSVSSTRVRTCMNSRSAMTTNVVPPETFCDADWMT